MLRKLAADSFTNSGCIAYTAFRHHSNGAALTVVDNDFADPALEFVLAQEGIPALQVDESFKNLLLFSLVPGH